MATTVDHPADSESLRASHDPELTARFVNDAVPYLNQLRDRARRLTRNAADADALATLSVHFRLAVYYGDIADFGAERSLGSWSAAKAPSYHAWTAGANDYETCCELIDA